MKAVKYLVAGLFVMGLAAPAMAQDVNYKDALKPIETTLKAGNVDAKEFAKEVKVYQKTFKKILRLLLHWVMPLLSTRSILKAML